MSTVIVLHGRIRNHQQRAMDQYPANFNNNQPMENSRYAPVSSYYMASSSTHQSAMNQTSARIPQNTSNQPATFAQAPQSNFANYQTSNRNNYNAPSTFNQRSTFQSVQPQTSLNRNNFNSQNAFNQPSASAQGIQPQGNLTNVNPQNSLNPPSTYAANSASFNDNGKRTDREKVRLLTGNVEKVIKWHKLYKESFCYYEVIAPIISIQEGTVRLQKILLLRDKNGPILQVTYYIHDHINIENFQIGQQLRCVGRMVGPNILHGLSIREASPGEVATLARMSYISQHAIAKTISRHK